MRKPATCPEILRRRGCTRQVRQVYVAPGGVLVPAKHGVDGFGGMGTAQLVNAAHFNPISLKPVAGRLSACHVNLLVASLGAIRAPDRHPHLLLKRDLPPIFPGVREDCVGRCLADELVELSSLDVDQPHGGVGRVRGGTKRS